MSEPGYYREENVRENIEEVDVCLLEVTTSSQQSYCCIQGAVKTSPKLVVNNTESRIIAGMGSVVVYSRR